MQEKNDMSENLSFKQKAYLLIRIQPGTESEFYGELKKLPNIIGIDLVHGPYDFVVVAEGSASDIDKVVLRIRKIPHIITTETMTAFTLT
jgi:hypothetical protein